MSILIITSKIDITSDFVVKSLKLKKLDFYRLNTEDIGRSLQITFDFNANKFLVFDRQINRTIDLLEIKSVYFRRPEINDELAGVSPGERNFVRSEILFVLEGIYKILRNAFWINTVEAIRNAENKIFQQLLAKQLKLQTPDSLITNVPSYAQNFYLQHDASCIIKPIKSGLVEGVNEEGVIFTNKVEINDDNNKRISVCPVYLQNLIEKEGDVRITVIGKRLFPALIHSQYSDEARIDWRKSSLPLKHTILDLPSDIAQKCLDLTNLLNLNFAAIDLILDKNGNFIFLEINPNGQWAWIEKRLNFNISDEITTLLAEGHPN
ncbi:MvdC/MvdD family ATP grasp protein [Mucilaginibacter sp. E4BP6]|uniref:MvdC/MvdD family ATP grasp protein n=1 Tax=Mucilaginibacter sp. E4BP6 TaxID=2723089 RepID=UPI003977C416